MLSQQCNRVSVELQLPLLLPTPLRLWQTSDFSFIIKVKADDASSLYFGGCCACLWMGEEEEAEEAPISNFKTRNEFLLTFSRRAKPRIFANTLVESTAPRKNLRRRFFSYDKCLVNAVFLLKERLCENNPNMSPNKYLITAFSYNKSNKNWSMVICLLVNDEKWWDIVFEAHFCFVAN